MARFFRKGVSQFHFLPAVVVLTAPTAPEIAAGTDLTPSVAEPAGWELTNQPINVPDFKDRFTKTIIGEDSAGTPSLTFYDTDAIGASAIRTALAKDAAGFIMLSPYGSGTGKRAEIWPVRSTGCNDEYVSGNEAARFKVQFAVTDTPVQNALLP